MVKLPDSLLEMVTDSIENLHDEYKCALENWIDTLDLKNVKKFDTILASSTYKEYEMNAKQYFCKVQMII